MGKFQLRKPKIISKNFPEVGSHIDNVSKSLNDLVFSYSLRVDKALQKKHMMMALSSLVLILVVGSFISPRGKADIATFYPETCLGGWSNPRNAEKEPETTSNADPSQFNDKNSAILDKNTSADIYCGNFNGTFNDATVPKKIIVSLAITNKEEITIGVIASSTEEVVSVASSTEVNASTTEVLLVASSTNTITEGGTTTATTTETLPVSTVAPEAATTTPKVGSFVDIFVDGVTGVFNHLINGESSSSDTDTVVVPAPVIETPAPTESAPAENTPTSFLNPFFRYLSSTFVHTVFAQEESVEGTSTGAIEVTSEEVETALVSTSTLTTLEATTTTDLASTTASSTDELVFAATSTATSTFETVTDVSTSTEEEDTQNNFLEIFYTFDGTTWVSLGELNEISMKYRTFEIPLSASSTWSDMSQLQIKVATKSLLRETPVTYLDGVKVEVLYDSTLEYSHPDFVRDTILTDETIDGMRLVTIINNENNEEETWYMYLDEEVMVGASSTDSATTTATSTPLAEIMDEAAVATSTLVATTTELQATSTQATSTDMMATSTASSSPVITPVIPKNKWFKLERREEWSALSPRELVEEIKKDDKENEEELEAKKKKEERLPDFAKDIIKRIKGALLNAIIVQVEKDGKEELWLYDLESGKEQKIQDASSTAITIAKDMPIGIKGTHLFWLSEDRSSVYAFNLVDKSIQVAEVPQYDASLGERGRVTFSDIPWEVIIGGQDFAFYSEATGEVFSDDDSSLSEALRRKFELDKVLDTDAISNLNLSVTATSSEE